MNYKQREKVAQQGIEILKTNTFPNEVLQNIKDKRVRTDVSDKIFYPKDTPKHDELSPEEKKARAKRLKVELSFVREMSGLESFRKSSLILVFVGFLMLALSVVNENGNVPFSIITIAEGLFIFVIGMNNALILKHANTIFLAFIGLFVIELAAFQIPNPVLTSVNSNVLASRRGALLKIVNLMSPYLYLTAKISVIGIYYYTKSTIDNFQKSKSDFEATRHIKK